MKKLIVTAFCAMFVLLSVGARAECASFASIERLQKGDADYAEVSALGPRIVDEVNEVREDDGKQLMNEEVIDWSAAYKIYVDENDIYSSLSENPEDITYDGIQNRMEYYVWMLPIYVDGDGYTVTISVGTPLDDEARSALTDEQIAQEEADVGKWCPVLIEEAEYTAAMYEQSIRDIYDGNLNRVFLMGGSPKMRSMVAIAEDEEKQIRILVLEEPRIIGQKVNSSQNAARAKSAKVRSLAEGGDYSFEQVAAILGAYELPEEGDPSVGGGGEATAAESVAPTTILVFIALAAALVLLLVWKKRKTA